MIELSVPFGSPPLKAYVQKRCPLLFRLLDARIPGDTPIPMIPEMINAMLAPHGLNPLVDGQEERTASVRRVEAFLETLDEDVYESLVQSGSD